MIVRFGAQRSEASLVQRSVGGGVHRGRVDVFAGSWRASGAARSILQASKNRALFAAASSPTPRSGRHADLGISPISRARKGARAAPCAGSNALLRAPPHARERTSIRVKELRQHIHWASPTIFSIANDRVLSEHSRDIWEWSTPASWKCARCSRSRLTRGSPGRTRPRSWAPPGGRAWDMAIVQAMCTMAPTPLVNNEAYGGRPPKQWEARGSDASSGEGAGRGTPRAGGILAGNSLEG